MTRVLLADDHPLFRDGVAALLQAHGFELVGQASSGLEAVELARQLHPDLVLMDINMPNMDGLAATRVITSELPSTRVIILTVSDDDGKLFEAIKSGAQGYLLKNMDTMMFLELLTNTAHGEAAISRRLAGKILSEFARRAPDGAGLEERQMTEREKQVLRLVADGLTNRDIAAQLSLSENTIKYHLKNILQKLHLRNRAQAVAYALQSGLVEPRKQ